MRAIERAAGALATASVARMDDVLPWFRGLPADQRSWVTLVAQAGVRSFVEWLRNPEARGRAELSDEIFDAAPRTLARSISLQHTVQLIKVTIDVVEEQVPRLAAPGEEQTVADAMLRFSREVAFSAARVYARAAESRGTWDARLQALLVDALLRGDAPDEITSRAAALGWDDRSPVAVAVGRAPGGEAAAILHTVHRLARRMGVDVLGGVHGSRLVLVLGGAEDPLAASEKLLAGVRRRPGGGRPGRADPGRGDRVGPGRAGRLPGRAGLADRAPAGGRRPTCCPSGRWPATPRPGGSCGTRCTGRWCARAASCWRRSTGSSPPAACWRARPGRCTSTRTRCVTACGVWARSPAFRHCCRAMRSPCGSPWRWAGWTPRPPRHHPH